MQDIAQLNQEVERSGKLENYDDVLHAFLWGSDPSEKYHNDVMFNYNHLLGLLVCRATPLPEQEMRMNKRLTLMSKRPKDMNLKELKDTLANIQFELPAFLNKIQGDEQVVQIIGDYLQECMYRVGQFVNGWHHEKILNDVGDTCGDVDPESKRRRLTDSATRRILAAILLLSRYIDLYDLSEELEPMPEYETGITAYHHEASTEHFHKLCMHYYLPIAAKLQYKHDFPGMYNDVSQAVFFHDSLYKRTNRFHHSSMDPLHALPSLHLMYPEIKIRFEDDLFDPILGGDTPEWYWLVIPKRIYLVSPEPQVYFAKDIGALLNLYLEINKLVSD